VGFYSCLKRGKRLKKMERVRGFEGDLKEI